MKGCPKCGQRWQDGNFCPVDGAKLEAVADGGAGAQTGPMPAQSRATAGEAPAAEDTDATVVEMSAIPASLAAEWLAAHRGAPVADPAARTAPDQVAKPAAAQAPASRPAAAAQAPAADVQQTRVELQAVPMSAAQRGQREARAAVPEPKKQLGDTALERIADRIKAEVARERPITAGSTLHTEAAPDPEAPTSAVARAEAKAARVEKKPTVEKRAPAAPKDEFSETQWFMKGLEVDADLLEVVDESEYKRSDKISDAQRSRMTLRRKDED
ncbi:MAG: hypothetical protein R3F39_16835 [Myxococcota bacterium]